jgi:16S rRNA (cytosine967-C5)-methyltransferase
MTKTNAPAQPDDAWLAAAGLLTRWLDKNERVDALLAGLPPSLGRAGRAHCQHLLFDAVRHLGRIEAALSPLLSHPPRAKLRAALLITGGELLDALGAGADAGAESKENGEGKTARIVHHAVERTKAFASPAEARLVNAVARKLAAALAAQSAPGAGASATELAEWFSHPVWLVARWLVQFGPEKTRALLEWNQRNAPVYARWRDAQTPPPAWLKPTAWGNFFEVPQGHWHEVELLLRAGKIYLQDPGARLAVELLAPQAGETVLDLCAAPGGKSLLIADAMAGKKQAAASLEIRRSGFIPDTSGLKPDLHGAASQHGVGDAAPAAGKLVALDLPGQRIDRLKENLSRARGVEVALVQGDVLLGAEKSFREHRLPEFYDAVLLDAPCSNTGVMRHRVDVRWRLQEGDFHKHAAQQLALLHAAARLVAPNGRLVYSTCSLDAEENARVVTAFFESRAGGPFKLEAQTMSYPWESGHDGAGLFLLRKGSG